MRHNRDDEDDVVTFQRLRRPTRPRRPPPPPPEQSNTYFFSDHGPDPVPDWVITEEAATQFERGVLKTGKEADVHLVERQLGAKLNLLAAKRYRSLEQRDFENDAPYRERLRTGNRRVDLAITKGTARGRTFRAEVWADHEWDVLRRLWCAGLSVPYPVQKRGQEIMLEYLGNDEIAAPRLADARTSRRELVELAAQAVDALDTMTASGVVHGDLSAFNTLVWAGRLYVIDLPQSIHPQDADGLVLLQRDVTTLLGWFEKRGVDIDVDSVFARLAKSAFGR